jgi:hypothetical protein
VIFLLEMSASMRVSRECKIDVVSSVFPYLYPYISINLFSIFVECQWMSGTPTVSIQSLCLLDLNTNKFTDYFILLDLFPRFFSLDGRHRIVLVLDFVSAPHAKQRRADN